MSEFYGINTDALPIDERFSEDSPLKSELNIDKATDLCAEAMFALFGLDKVLVKDKLQSDFELLPSPGAGDLPVVGLNLVDSKKDGITPSMLVAGYNKVAKNTGNLELYMWDEMYLTRKAAWYNRRLPFTESNITNDSLFGGYLIGAAYSVEGTNKSWEEQQEQLDRSSTLKDASATEGATVSDMIIYDAMSIISAGELNRIDVGTTTRFVQHQRDVRDGRAIRGPSTSIFEGRLRLSASIDRAENLFGFRRLVGPAKI